LVFFVRLVLSFITPQGSHDINNIGLGLPECNSAAQVLPSSDCQWKKIRMAYIKLFSLHVHTS